MEPFEDRFHELLDAAEAEGHAPHTGPILDQAFRLAERHGDMAKAVLARYLYVFAVAPIEPDRALVGFAWCVAHQHEAGDVLSPEIPQLYGIAVGILRSYPDYSLAQIEATFGQMEQAYERLGLDMREVWHHRIYGMLGIGDRERAAEYYERWSTAERNAGACRACDAGTRVLYHLHLERYERGLQLAEPLLSQRMLCSDGQPLMTLAAVLLPLIKLRRSEEARRCYLASAQMLGELSYAGIWIAGRQLSFLALCGEVEEAVASLERHAPVALRRGTPTDRYGYLLAFGLLARRLCDEPGAEVRLRLPSAYPAAREDARYDPRALLDAVCVEIAELGARFDARNGNDEYKRVAREFGELYEAVRSSAG